MNRRLLKQQAKQTIQTSKPNVLLVSTLFIVLSSVFSYYQNVIYTKNAPDEAIAKAYQFYLNGQYDYFISMIEKMAPPSYAPWIAVVIDVILSILTAGLIIFLFNTIRRTEPVVGNLLDGFGFFFKIILLNLLEGILVFLWTLLLIVPGIIASYRYKMAIYILCDDPSKSVRQCLKESSAMMKGHKWEYFVLNLSFLGWYIGESIPAIGYIVQIWSFPYIQTTRALYYEMLRLGSEPIESL